MDCVKLLLDRGAQVNKVRDVIIHRVHAMQYVPSISSRGMMTSAQEPCM